MGEEANWRTLNESREKSPPLTRSPYPRVGLMGHLDTSRHIWTRHSRRWIVVLPKTADYYYDEAVPEILSKHSPEDEFLLSDIDLSDA